MEYGILDAEKLDKHSLRRVFFPSEHLSNLSVFLISILSYTVYGGI